MKALVVYWSKTGFVEKYAKWIGEEIKADIISGKKIKKETLENYDTLVFGGSLYAVGINGADFIKNNIEILKNKKVAVFATGASPRRPEIIEEVKNENFTKEQMKYFKFFYLRGGFNYNNLTFKDKILMQMMKWKLKNKKNKNNNLTEDEKGMLEAFDNPVDFTDKRNIIQLVNYLKT